MPRLSLANVAASDLPELVGLCKTDLGRIAAIVNLAQEQLILAGTENGWWGGWARVVFNVNQTDPFITLPFQFARAINLDACRSPVPVQNEWYEFLEAGIGLQKNCAISCSPMNALDRGTVPTAYDLTATNQYLRVYVTDARDVGKRIAFINAKDQNGNYIYSTDVFVTVPGFYMLMAQPFTTSPYIVTAFAGVQKDVTYGDVIVKQVDATTGTEVLLARYAPQETNPSYRRYLLKGLPGACCVCPGTGQSQVTVMAKYEYFPALQPADFLIIANLPALTAECQSIRHSRMDDPTAKQLSIQEHLAAINFLNKQMQHYFGSSQIAVNLAPFGTARLEYQNIGGMM